MVGFGGEFQDGHVGADGVDTGLGGGAVEFDGCSEVDFCDDREVGGVENGGVFAGFVFAFGDGEKDETEVFAEVVAGGADEVADVFDEEQVEVLEVPVFEGIVDHLCVEVAGGAGDDLLDGRSASSKSHGVVVGCEVSDESGDAEVMGAAHGERFFEEHGFARAGA